MTPNSQCWLRGSWRGRTFKIFIPQTPRKLSLRVPCSGRNGYCRLDHCWKLHQELPLVEGILQDYCLILVNLDPITGSLSSVQSLSRVRLFATPWITARQASLSITISQSSLRLTSIESVMPSSHFILGRPLPSCHQSLQHQNLFQWVNSSHEVAKVLEFQL